MKQTQPWIIGTLIVWGVCGTAMAQQIIQYGTKVPMEVVAIYERGLKHLASTQLPEGRWPTTGIPQHAAPGGAGGAGGAGIASLGLMAFLASGEDPNFGRYAINIRKALRFVILSQDPETGYIPYNMYEHGFATLALSEAYGAVDEQGLWTENDSKQHRRTIGQALELAVRCAVASQKESRWKGWRYSPTATDADSSVSGTVLVGLLAARNAGIEVPDKTINQALDYFKTSTTRDGMVSYTITMFGGSGESMARSALATLVYSVGKKQDWEELAATVKYISSNLEYEDQRHPWYFRYYMAQALFQGDYEAWQRWNALTTRMFMNEQREDGGFSSKYGDAYGTSMALLTLALNYRFLPIYER